MKTTYFITKEQLLAIDQQKERTFNLKQSISPYHIFEDYFINVPVRTIMMDLFGIYNVQRFEETFQDLDYLSSLVEFISVHLNLTLYTQTINGKEIKTLFKGLPIITGVHEIIEEQFICHKYNKPRIIYVTENNLIYSNNYCTVIKNDLEQVIAIGLQDNQVQEDIILDDLVKLDAGTEINLKTIFLSPRYFNVDFVRKVKDNTVLDMRPNVASLYVINEEDMQEPKLLSKVSDLYIYTDGKVFSGAGFDFIKEDIRERGTLMYEYKGFILY